MQQEFVQLGMAVIKHVRHGCLFSGRYAAGFPYFSMDSWLLVWLIGLIIHNYK